MEYQKDLDSMMDDLLSGKLSAAEETQLMQQIEQNPDLKADFDFQNDVVNALRDTRKAELKARLDAVVVEPALVGLLYNSMFTKVAASLIVATTVGVGVYYFTSKSYMPQEMSALTPKSVKVDLSKVDAPSLPVELQRFDLSKIDNKTLTASASNKIVVLPKQQPKMAEEIIPSFAQPKIAESFDDEHPITPTLEAIPSVNKSKMSDTAPEIENIEDASYPFHYRYFENKLYLYGDFKGIPYQIIEIHGVNGRSTYLHYKQQYFTLKASVKDIVPLEPITDQELIGELELLKSEKSF